MQPILFFWAGHFSFVDTAVPASAHRRQLKVFFFVARAVGILLNILATLGSQAVFHRIEWKFTLSLSKGHTLVLHLFTAAFSA